MARPARILHTILLRVLPPAVLAFLAIWFMASWFTEWTQRTDINDRLAMQAMHIAASTADEIHTLLDATQALATNHLVMQGVIVDRTEHERALPMFFESLRIPGPKEVAITLVDAHGASIVSNRQPLPSYANAPWLGEVIGAGREQIQLSHTGLRIAVPVSYAGLPTGILVVEYGPAQLTELLATTPHLEAHIFLDQDGRVLFSSRSMLAQVGGPAPPAQIDGWIQVRVPVPGFPQLLLVAAIPQAEALKSLYKLERFLLSGILSALVVLIGGIVLSTHLIARPLASFIERISHIQKSADLDCRVEPSGPAEFHQLSHSINTMLEELQKTTVSRNYVDNILQSMMDILIVVAPDGTIQTINAAASMSLGYAADELAGQPFGYIFAEEDADSAENYWFDQLQSQGTVRNIEKIYLAKDGRVIPVLMAGATMHDEAGALAGIVYVAQDITERKHAEEELNRFFLLSRDMLCILGYDGHFKRLNPAWEETLGFSQDAFLSHSFLSFVHRADRDATRQELKRLGTGLDTVSFESRCKCKGGDYKWFLWKATPFPEQRLIYATARDITERKRAEEELFQSAERVRAVVNNVVDSIMTIDDQGLIESCNPAAERLFGYPAAEIIGQSLTTLIPGLSPSTSSAILSTALRDTAEEMRGLAQEIVGQRRDGSTFPIDWAISEMRLGSRRMFIAITRNITARKKVEADLLMAKESAERANLAKSEFLAKMSHELRTPLNSVIGFSNILLKNKHDTLGHKDIPYLQRIQANGTHLLRLINDILDLSKVEAGHAELDLTRIALPELAQEILEQFEGQLRGRHVTLQADMPAVVGPLETDAGKLKQVLINLIGNALKFTKRGSVTVRVGVDPDTFQPTYLEVVDTGIGIPPDRLEAIFEAFQQADNSTARKYGGTGLGLAISRSLCGLLGYELTVTSAAGKGSTFRMLLATDAMPADHPGDAEGDQTVTPVSLSRMMPMPTERVLAKLKGKEVLIIDDDSDSRILLSQHFAEWDCHVSEATSGAEGLRKAKACRPALITLDLHMPHMSGAEVLRVLRADRELRDIPIIVVSITAGEKLPYTGGVVEYLEKPVAREEFLRVLWRTLLIYEDEQALKATQGAAS